MKGNRVVSLVLLGQFIEMITKHTGSCLLPLNFLGESHHCGLASVMACQCLKYSMVFWFISSEMITYSTINHYMVHIGIFLGQIATGGGADHLNTPKFLNNTLHCLSWITVKYHICPAKLDVPLFSYHIITDRLIHSYTNYTYSITSRFIYALNV